MEPMAYYGFAGKAEVGETGQKKLADGLFHETITI